jgi:hypothetical protein
MWIADLAAHGLTKASFAPDEDRQELRSHTSSPVAGASRHGMFTASRRR